VSNWPDAPPSKEASYASLTCADCAPPPPKGPALALTEPEKLLSEANGSWLLAMALKRFEQASSNGVADVGAFGYVSAESEKQKQAALSGVELATPHGDTKGFAGYAYYKTLTDAEKLATLGNNTIDIEMKVWRVNRQKNVPTSGLTATMRYSKAGPDSTWVLTSVKTDNRMSLPAKGFFPNWDNHPELVEAFYAKKATQ
jgi:hypothetical protein